jgi:hypothetical protein
LLPGGYNDNDWMTRYGGVPTEYQVDGYLAQIAASSTQKTAVTTTRATAHGHAMPIGKIKDLLNVTT